MTVTFPDSSNLETVACEKMMSPGRGRVNRDRDGDCACVSPRVTWPSNSRNAAGQLICIIRSRSAPGRKLDKSGYCKSESMGSSTWARSFGQILIVSFSGDITNQLCPIAPTRHACNRTGEPLEFLATPLVGTIEHHPSRGAPDY
jgi:hypothetical protein